MKTFVLKDYILIALFSAIIFVFTYIGIQVPTFGAIGGLTHLGTLVMFVIAIKYGKYYGMASAAIGMTLFDLLSPWAAWAPGTFVVRLIAGYVFGLVATSKDGQGASLYKNTLSLLAGGLVITTGYYLFESLFISDFVAAQLSIPGNILQIIIASLGLFIVRAMPNKEDMFNV